MNIDLDKDIVNFMVGAWTPSADVKYYTNQDIINQRNEADTGNILKNNLQVSDTQSADNKLCIKNNFTGKYLKIELEKLTYKEIQQQTLLKSGIFKSEETMSQRILRSQSKNATPKTESCKQSTQPEKISKQSQSIQEFSIARAPLKDKSNIIPAEPDLTRNLRKRTRVDYSQFYSNKRNESGGDNDSNTQISKSKRTQRVIEETKTTDSTKRTLEQNKGNSQIIKSERINKKSNRTKNDSGNSRTNFPMKSPGTMRNVEMKSQRGRSRSTLKTGKYVETISNKENIESKKNMKKENSQTSKTKNQKSDLDINKPDTKKSNNIPAALPGNRKDEESSNTNVILPEVIEGKLYIFCNS